jgi:anti-sigma28 factor (negative regulator of flagellin synthesis)
MILADDKQQIGLNMLNLTPAAAEFDLNRVNQVRTKLEEDDYIVDSLLIADRIIDLEMALSGQS